MRVLKPIAIIVAVVAFVALWYTGAGEVLTQPQRIRAWVLSAGVWGPVVFIALAMGLFTVFLLGPPVWASVTIWPAPEAFVYAYAASILASLVTYAIAMRWGAEWADQRLPESFRPWEERVRRSPYLALLGLRLMLWANPLVDLFAAVVRVKPGAYLATTLVGIAIATAFQIGIGLGGSALFHIVPWWAWALGAGLGVVIWWYRRR